MTETWETVEHPSSENSKKWLDSWLIWQCCLSISVGRDHIASWISVLQVISSPADHSSVHKQLPKRAAQSITIAKQNRKSKLKTMVLWGKSEQALNSRAVYRPHAILNNFDSIFVLLLKCLISTFKCWPFISFQRRGKGCTHRVVHVLLCSVP